MKAVVDRVVQYPHRYQLKNVNTGEVLGTFDLEPITGTISVVGTKIDKELFDSIASDISARLVSNGGDAKDNVITFNMASSRSNVASGEKLSVSLGKIAKYFNDLKAVAFSGNKKDIDLGNVDNTSDANKPVSNATQQALNLKANANDVYSKTKTDELLNNKANKSDVYTKSETDNKINKPLYNLGAYDTISGNVITRQTGYVDLGTLSWKYETTNGLNVFVADLNTIAENDGYCAKYGYVKNYSDVINNSNKLYIGGNPRKTIYISDTTYTDADTFKTAMQGVMLQYKLSTPYTEEIIEGQPLITLDQQGSQWLRNEWEKGLNVFDKDTVTIGNGYDYTATASDWVKAIDIPVEPNTAYTASSIISRYAFNHGDIVADYNKNTITTGSDTKTLSLFIYVGSYSGTAKDWFSNYMLNEGDHPYPYQAYNGEIVHDKDIADLYKQEYNLGYYDTMVENSDGTYTITRQTGYLLLDGVKNKFDYKMGSTINAEYAYNGLIDYISRPSSSSKIADIISNTLKTISADDLYSQNTYGIAIDTQGIILVGLTTAITTIDEANAYLVQNPISIQYKLATATTERVEKNHYARYNQTFILEHNKSEAERSANLSYVTLITSTSELYKLCIRLAPFDFKKGVTYTLSFNTENTGCVLFLNNYADFGLGYMEVIADGTRKSFTFTPKKDALNYRVGVSNNSSGISTGTCSNVMLNIGSVALPYQAYEGKVVHEKELESITPGIFSLVGNNVDTLTISKNETYFITSVEALPIYVEGNAGISFYGSSLVSTVGLLGGSPRICINGSAYTLDSNSVTLKSNGLMKVYKVG